MAEEQKVPKISLIDIKRYCEQVSEYTKVGVKWN